MTDSGEVTQLRKTLAEIDSGDAAGNDIGDPATGGNLAGR